jgi:hypothetical protein
MSRLKVADDNVAVVCYRMGRFGPVRRVPSVHVVYEDQSDVRALNGPIGDADGRSNFSSSRRDRWSAV